MVWILETIDILYNILRNGETSYIYIYIYICPTTNCSHLQTITLFIVDNVNNIHTCVCVCVCVCTGQYGLCPASSVSLLS